MSTESVTTKPTFLWIADPFDSLDHETDTTIRLLRESIFRGNSNFWAEVKSAEWRFDQSVWARHVTPEFAGSSNVSLSNYERYSVSRIDLIILRVDPPVSAAYAGLISSLAHSFIATGRDPERWIINSPTLMLIQKSRLLALRSGLAPTSILSSEIRDIADFSRQVGAVVLKSLDGHAGKGISLIKRGSNRATIAKLVSKTQSIGSEAVIAQRYLANHLISEKRVLFVDGAPIFACKKLFAEGLFPPSLASGNCASSTALEKAEIQTCLRVGEILKHLNLRVAGVDLIDGWVTDVNFISPGLLVEMEMVAGFNLAGRILRSIESG